MFLFPKHFLHFSWGTEATTVKPTSSQHCSLVGGWHEKSFDIMVKGPTPPMPTSPRKSKALLRDYQMIIHGLSGHLEGVPLDPHDDSSACEALKLHGEDFPLAEVSEAGQFPEFFFLKAT